MLAANRDPIRHKHPRMNPLVSILIPSRALPERLLAAIESIFKGADNPNDLEILVRMDDDDDTMRDTSVFNGKAILFLTGKRGAGYLDHHIFYDELASASTGKWAWFMNDDCLVQGAWMEQLRSMEPAWVVPGLHVRGESAYPKHCGDIGFPIVPNGCWKKYGMATIPRYPDRFLYRLLVTENSWPVSYLDGVTFNHRRDSYADLERHRSFSTVIPE